MVLKFILIGIIGYFAGAFSPAYFIGKYVKKIDLRDKGSGNLGSTNVMRVLGAKCALITFLCDTAKGFVIMLISDLLFFDIDTFNGAISMLIGGITVVLGHNFPFYLNFKGGKGIATTFGVVLYLNPISALILLAIEWVITLTTGFVSLASVINCVALPFLINLIQLGVYAKNDLTWALCIALAVIAIIRHIPNINRLLHGKENRFILTKTIKAKQAVFKDKQLPPM